MFRQALAMDELGKDEVKNFAIVLTFCTRHYRLNRLINGNK